jgi:restriction system protein
MIGRRKSREIEWLVLLAQLTGIGIFAGYLFPNIRQWLQAIALLAVVSLILTLAALMALRNRRKMARIDGPAPQSAVGPNISWARTSTESGATVAALHRLRPNQLKNDARELAAAEITRNLREVDWFQFEKIIEILYRNLGCQVTRRGGANPDGGIDLVIERDGEKIAVQCKQWKSSNVRIRGMREFLGALTHAGIPRGIFITLHGYTSEATQLADEHNIEILDETGLAQLLEQAGARFDPVLLDALQDRRKSCPKCEAEMILRTAKKGPNADRQFWGCSQYPRCQEALEAGR